MAFPTTPTNGQVTVVNQVSYQYSSATNSWTRILSTANVITANTIAVNGALTVGTTISAAGNITGSYYFGNGSQLTGVAAATAGFPISAGNSNIAASPNANIAISVGGTSNVAVFATTGEYITGVLSASGTITGGNLETGGTASAAGNVTGGNILTGGLISATGTVTGSSFLGAVVSVTANVTGGNVLTGGLISATSTITSAANITGGNLLTGGLISATSDITSAANITGGNVLTGGLVSATANITGGNVLTAGLISATSTITSAANITGGNVLTAGLVSATGNVTGNFINGNGYFLTGIITSVANINNGTSNVNIAAPDANVTVSVNGTSNVAVFASTGEYITGVLSASGNVTGGNVLTGGLISATGNITGGNLLTGGLISAGGNITSSTNVNTPNVVGATGLTISTGSGDLVLTPSGNINAFNNYINNLLDPVQAQDAASKQYVDNAVSSGITIHTPVLVESPTALNATYAQGGTTATVTSTVAGNTVVFGSAISPQVNDQYWFTSAFNGILANTAYFVVSAPNTSAAVLSTSYNGVPVANITGATGLTQPVRINSGIGATLTNAGANATLTIDGVTLSNTNRVLVYTQANAVHNGVYVVSEAGNATTAWQLTRSTDTDVYGPKSIEELDAGDYFFVQSGDTGAGESYVMTAPEGTFIIGYNNLTFTQFSSSQVYTANTAAGLSLIGTVFNAKVDGVTTAFDGGGNISVKASANLTTPNIGAATGTSLSATGDITGGNLLTGGVISATSTITSAANIAGGNLLTGGLISATSTITSAANITGGNLLTAGLVSATGNVTGNYILGNGYFLTGVITSVANINNGTSNVNIAAANANVTVSVNGTSNVAVFATTGEYITGELSASGNVTGGNVLTGGLISATSTITSAANITGGNLLTGGLISATSTITSAANITGGNVLTGGLVSATANVTGGNLLTGGVISATGNITGGNVTATNYYYANGVAIVNYTASTTPPASPLAGWQWYNTSTDVLYEYLFDGTDDYWVDVSSPAFSNGPAGNMSISGSLLPSANITYDLGSTTNRWKDLWLAGTTLYLGDAVLSASGTSVSLGTGNVTGGNVTTAGIVSATGNITGSYIFGNGSQLTGVDATQIINGTSNAKVSGSGGNIAVTIGGTANVGVFYTGGLSITGDLAVTGNATLSGNILGDRIQNGTTQIDIQSANGNANITVGGTSNVAVFTTAGMTITGNIENGGSNGTGNIGSASTYFNTIFGKATTAQYADLAENYLGDAEYAPGTVLDFDGAQEVTLSTRDSSKRVAGVVSTNPAHLMNSTLDGAHVTAVALAGRVPTQVTGKIAKGDLMVSAGNGRARAEANPSTGTVIGKALENFDGGEGTIEIVISMQ